MKANFIKVLDLVDFPKQIVIQGEKMANLCIISNQFYTGYPKNCLKYDSRYLSQEMKERKKKKRAYVALFLLDRSSMVLTLVWYKF